MKRKSTKQNILIVKKNLKRGSISLATMEILKTEPGKRYHFTPTKWLKFKKLIIQME